MICKCPAARYWIYNLQFKMNPFSRFVAIVNAEHLAVSLKEAEILFINDLQRN